MDPRTLTTYQEVSRLDIRRNVISRRIRQLVKAGDYEAARAWREQYLALEADFSRLIERAAGQSKGVAA